MKRMKKPLSLALALVMCLSLAAPAFAADSDFDTNGPTLKRYKGAGGAVTIPDGITAISSYAFSHSQTVTGVTLPNTVTVINNYAFEFSGALRSVTLSTSLTSIKYQAFIGCSALESVVIPDSVIEIGGSAFSGCNSLKSVTLSKNLVSLGSWAFHNCNSLTSISIPGTVASVDNETFSGCTSLKTATIYDGVTGIGQNAFRSCPSLTRVTIPASVTSIGMGAFYEEPSLKDVYYGGTEEQWKAIKVGSMNGPLSEATIHYNSPMPQPAPSFNDVPLGQYYAVPVAWASGLGIANGTGGGKFDPDQQCTQEQILTFLYRGARTEDGPFVAASGADMAAAVEWAREKGMIDGSFVGSTLCTRATAVYFIWMAFDAPNASGSAFKDIPAGADYTVSVSWAVGQGVTNGTGGGNFSPNDTCTRGQIVTFLYRAYN